MDMVICGAAFERPFSYSRSFSRNVFIHFSDAPNWMASFFMTLFVLLRMLYRCIGMEYASGVC